MKCSQRWTLVVFFLVHVIFLVSIFDIYFTSPIVKEITPVKNNVPAPAKRLVLFIGDGLRTDSFYSTHKNSTIVPYLREVIERRGRWGVSHTRVPTESRPGHVAIIAGLYEDPSAIFRGWKDYPVDFDSVFNQSAFTFGWGSPDIMSIFNRGLSKQNVFLESYPSHMEEFSGNADGALRTSLWTLDKFKILLENSKTDDALRECLNSRQLIFFFHMLGIDTVGHSHKPHSKEYADNIRVADQIVKDVESLVRSFYRDNDTVYIFTSDHGMTDWGSHGEGSLVETETPFVAWGAGIQHPSRVSALNNFPEQWNLNHLRRDDINQADIAPLMSVLLGISIPVNSLGTLPISILDSAVESKVAALMLNAQQILAQFLRMKETIEETTFKWFYRTYDGAASKWEEEFRTVSSLVQERSYDAALKVSTTLIADSLAGLQYYQNYYQNFLLFFIASAYIGWICWLVLNVSKDDSLLGIENGSFRSRKYRWIIADAVFFGLILTTSVMLSALSLPYQYHLYCNVPIIIWWSVIRKLVTRDFALYNKKSLCSSAIVFLTAIAGTEFVVLSFFERRALCVVILALSSWPWFSGLARSRPNLRLMVAWTMSCFALFIFPFLPIIGSAPNDYYIVLTFVIWFLFIVASWKYLKKFDSAESHKSFAVPCTLFIIAVCNVVYVSFSYSSKRELYLFNKLLSWVFLLTVPIIPLFYSRRLIFRLLNIYFCLGVVSFLFSLTHDALFLPLFCIHLLLWLLLENILFELHSTKHFGISQLCDVKFSRISLQKRNLLASDFRRAYVFFFYAVFSFFATGNIASINSFDTRSIRCFITVFSPFTMMVLLLFKIMIPFFITACTFRAVNVVSKVPIDRIFLIVMIYCDLMGLNFLFLVRNVGSWLEIGSSVSHYVIAQTVTLFLVFLYFLSSFVTCSKIQPLTYRRDKSRYTE